MEVLSGERDVLSGERSSFFQLILTDGEDFVRIPVAQCGREMGMLTSLVKYAGLIVSHFQQGMLLLDHREIPFGLPV